MSAAPASQQTPSIASAKADQLPLIDPKNDYVFKRLFGGAPQLLEALINAVRWPQSPLRVVTILNPEIEPEEIHGKFIILDVLAEDALGRRIGVEMQVRSFERWSARSAYYLARMLSQQISSGEQYQALQPVIGIHLLDFELFKQAAQAQQCCWCFHLRDRLQPDVRLGDELELNLIELPKADRLAQEGRWAVQHHGNGELGQTMHPDSAPSNVQATVLPWVQFLKHWQDERLMAHIDDPAVQLAMDRLRAISQDPRERDLAERRRLAKIMELAEREGGRAEGRAEGLAEGRSEGLAQSLIMLLTDRFGPLSDAELGQIQGAASPQLEAGLKRVLRAKTVGDVLAALSV